VIIVDDNKAFIEAVNLLFDKMPQFEVICCAYDGAEIVDHPELVNADLLLIDVNMPVLDGIAAGCQINYKRPDLKMVAVTLNCDRVYLEELIRAGFNGFIDKTKIVTSLPQVLSAVMNNKYVFPKDILVSMRS